MRPKNSTNIPERPNGIDSRIESIEIDDALKTMIDEQSGVTYVGKAHCGCKTDLPHWQIQRITESGSMTIIEWADGDTLFDNVFDDRATLTYR